MVHVPLIFLSEWCEFLAASRPRRLTCFFSPCNKKRLAIRHLKRVLFPTTLSIPSYDIGNKVRLKTYQHPLVSSMQRACAILSPVACSAQQYFSTLSHKGTIFEKNKPLPNLKRVLLFPLQIFSERFSF